MSWEYLKHILGELEEVVLKVFVIVSLLLVIAEILSHKVSALIVYWVQKFRELTLK
jgi:hypothetical protein